MRMGSGIAPGTSLWAARDPSTNHPVYRLTVVPCAEWQPRFTPPPIDVAGPARAAPGQANLGVLLAGSLALAACGTPHEPGGWRVAPVLRAGPATTATSTVEGYLQLARVYEHEGRWEQAAQALENATRLAPDEPALLTALGVALVRAGKPAKAVERFRQVAMLHPGDARALNNLGHALTLAGQPAEAARVLRLALAADPAHARARANLAALGSPDAAPAAAPPVAAAAPVAAPAPVREEAALAVVATPTAASLEVVPVAAAARLDVVPSAQAQQLVAVQPQQAGPSVGAAAPAPAFRLTVVNGVGVERAALQVARALAAAPGLQISGPARLQNLPPYQVRRTVVQYRPAARAAAEQVARQVGDGTALVEAAAPGATEDVRVVLGHDRREWLVACVKSQSCTAEPAAGQAVAMATHL